MEDCGLIAYRIVSVFMSLIQLRTRDRRGRLKRLNEQPNNQAPRLLPPVPLPQTVEPAGQNGELNSLFAKNRVGMEVGWWWSNGVQNSDCFYVVNIGTNKPSLCAYLSDWT